MGNNRTVQLVLTEFKITAQKRKREKAKVTAIEHDGPACHVMSCHCSSSHQDNNADMQSQTIIPTIPQRAGAALDKATAAENPSKAQSVKNNNDVAVAGSISLSS
jgi:hypothetical protein